MTEPTLEFDIVLEVFDGLEFKKAALSSHAVLHTYAGHRVHELPLGKTIRMEVISRDRNFDGGIITFCIFVVKRGDRSCVNHGNFTTKLLFSEVVMLDGEDGLVGFNRTKDIRFVMDADEGEEPCGCVLDFEVSRFLRGECFRKTYFARVCKQ